MEMQAETIPEDILAKALAISLCHKVPVGCIHPDDQACGDGCEIVIATARALMERDKAATERAAKIADRWKNSDTGYAIAAAIRSQP